MSDVTPAAAPDEPPSVDMVEFRTEQARTVLERVIPARFVHAHPDVPDVVAWVTRFVATPDRAPSLVLAGPTGVGKSHQAWGALRACVEGRAALGVGLTWRATNHPDLNSALRPKPDQSHTFALDPYLEAELLMLDDLGTGKQSEWTGDSLYRLVDHRWANNLPTIFTTNLSATGLIDAVGERVVSRLADAVRVTVKGRDRRWEAA